MMPTRDFTGFADGETPAAQLILLLHMGIDLVEDTAFEEMELRSQLLESLLNSMRLAIKWRSYDLPGPNDDRLPS